jgi:BolA protein
MRDRIAGRLRDAFAAQHLEVEDQSERHRGHAGWREGGETHFMVTLVSPEFAGLSRVERQRRVHAALTAELADGIHALSLRLRTPEEWAESGT